MISPLKNDLNRDLLRRIEHFFRSHDIEAYVVGGTVRDWLLGRASQDLDLAVAGDALSLTRRLADELGAAFVPLDVERATARAVRRAPGPDTYRYIDVARLRGDTLAADLAERDFTVNAMAVRLQDVTAGRLDIVDPLHGQEHLRAGRLQATSESAFRDDPLRLLRAVRLAAELDFTIEPQTQSWITAHAGSIRVAAPERVRDELVRLCACSGTAGHLRLMDQLGLLTPLFPEVVSCKGVDQPPIHQWDVFDHALATVDRVDDLLRTLEVGGFGSDGSAADTRFAPVQATLRPFRQALRSRLQAELVGGRPRFVLLKLVALLHDVGKPETQSVDEAGTIHFYGHEKVGVGMVTASLRRLHFGNREVMIGRTLTLHHMRPKWLASADKVTPRAIYRFFRDTRGSGVEVILLSLADSMATSDPPWDSAAWSAQLDITSRLLEAWFERRNRAVDPPALVRGSELIEALDLEPGPLVGELLEAIREAQVSDVVASRADALNFARDWVVGRRAGKGAEE